MNEWLLQRFVEEIVAILQQLFVQGVEQPMVNGFARADALEAVPRSFEIGAKPRSRAL